MEHGRFRFLFVGIERGVRAGSEVDGEALDGAQIDRVEAGRKTIDCGTLDAREIGKQGSREAFNGGEGECGESDSQHRR